MKKYLSMLMLGVTALLAVNTAQAGAIDEAVKRGTLKVGMDPTYMPFEMTNKRGEIIGFEVDLLKAMAKSMGVKLELVSTGYDGIIPAFLTGKFDMIGSGMTLTQERNLKIGFTDPYIQIGQSVLLNKKHEGTITSWQQLNDPKFLVISRQGTTGEEAVKRHIPKAQFKTFEKEADGALEVANGRADAWVYDMPFNVVFYAEQGEAKMVHLDTPFTFEPIAMGIKQGDPDFMNFLNNFLRQLKSDGRYDRIYNKWIKSTDWFAQTQR